MRAALVARDAVVPPLLQVHCIPLIGLILCSLSEINVFLGIEMVKYFCMTGVKSSDHTRGRYLFPVEAFGTMAIASGPVLAGPVVMVIFGTAHVQMMKFTLVQLHKQ